MTPVVDVGGGLWIKREDRSAPLYGGLRVRALEWILGEAQERGGDVLTAGPVGSATLVATAVHGKRVGVRVQALLLPDEDRPEGRVNARILHAHAEKLWPGAQPMQALKAWAAIRFLGGFRPTWVMPGGGLIGALGFVALGEEIADQVGSGSIPVPDRILVPAGTGWTAAGLLVGLRRGGLEVPLVALDVRGQLNRIWLMALARRVLRMFRGASVRLDGLELRRALPATLPPIPEDLPMDPASRLALGAVAADSARQRLYVHAPNGWPLEPLLASALTDIPASLLPLFTKDIR